MKNKFFKDTKVSIGVAVIAISILSIFGSIYLITQTYTVLKNSDNHFENVITLSGYGEVNAVPDVATFNYTVREVADTVEVAQSLATEKGNSILSMLEDQGIEEKDIKTT